MRVFVALATETDRSQQLPDPQMGIRLRFAAKAESDILFNGEMWKQRVILENHPDLPLLRRHPLADAADHLVMQPDFAAGDFLEAGDTAQQSGLAAARRTEQAGDLPLFQTKIDAIDDGMFAVALNNAI